LPFEERVSILLAAWRGLNTGLDDHRRVALLLRSYRDRRMANYPLQGSVACSRIYGLFSLVDEVNEVPGEIVECGVGRGGSLAAFVYAVSALKSSKAVYGFDSFAGFPSASVEDLGSRVRETGKVSGWKDTSPELISSIFEFDRQDAASLLNNHDVTLRIIPGFFEETLGSNLPAKIALLHVDCDLYDSTKTVLDRCLPKMSPGGIIIFDEYHDDRWPGCRRAADEVCGSRGLEVVYFDRAARFGVRMPAPGAASQIERSPCKHIA
jgi:hypothetical protein